jgi:hypothetical protein
MILLQLSAETVNNSFLQYGILGIVALSLAYFAWTQYNRLVEKNDTLEKKIDRLQEEMLKILVEERDRMSELIENNSKALRDLHSTILTYLIKMGANEEANEEPKGPGPRKGSRQTT